MTKRIPPALPGLVGAAVALLGLGMSLLAAEAPAKQRGAGPADPPPEYRNPPQEIKLPSVVPGRKAGIEVGQYAPDFQLQPIEPYAKLRDWVGDAPSRAAFSPRARPLAGLDLLLRVRARLPRSAQARIRVDDTQSADPLQSVKLSRLVGKAPILLLYGSYT